MVSIKTSTLNNIANFYENQTIFITGASGFVGKVLVEKLLRSCPKIEKIILLLRAKKGETSNQRLQQFIQSEIFINIKKDFIHKKIIAINGDITLPKLGINEDDYQFLINKVSIVFHSAASVRFDHSLKECLSVNVYATKSVLDLCHELKNLKAFVHVSTAFAFCNRNVSEEKVYLMKTSAQEILKAATEMDESSLEKFGSSFFEGRPNTYTFTKALAENYIHENKGNLPVAIARPSVITASWKEPVKGWIDSINGPGSACLLGSLGIARTMYFKPSNHADLIPVDIVANALIAIAWNLGNDKCDSLKVFNITSGFDNSIKWENFLNYGREAAVEAPSIKMIRPPVTVMRGTQVNSFTHYFTKYFSEILFAYIVDFILILTGNKTRFVKMVSRMHYAFGLMEYFALTEWSFPRNNLLELIAKMNENDREIFNCDVRGINWREYTHMYYLGMRKYLLKEDESNIGMAKKRMKMLYIGYYSAQMLLIFTLLYALFVSFTRIILV